MLREAVRWLHEWLTSAECGPLRLCRTRQETQAREQQWQAGVSLDREDWFLDHALHNTAGLAPGFHPRLAVGVVGWPRALPLATSSLGPGHPRMLVCVGVGGGAILEPNPQNTEEPLYLKSLKYMFHNFKNSLFMFCNI